MTDTDQARVAEIAERTDPSVVSFLLGCIAKRQAEIERLREALAFYAAGRHYQRCSVTLGDGPPQGQEAVLDRGERAREALKDG